MFKIYDGRESFYQWDLDRKLIVDDASISQVHFCNRTDECSLVCETYTEDGLNLVNVPNVLLQDDWRINVYAYDHNYTKHSTQYDVIRRSKPDSYVYTETETLNFNTLLNRVNEVDANIAQNVENYLKENPVEVDLTGYATETYVDNAIAAIPDPDLSDYALKTDIPSTVGLATEKYVDDAIANIDVPEMDVEGLSEVFVLDLGPVSTPITEEQKTIIENIYNNPNSLIYVDGLLVDYVEKGDTFLRLYSVRWNGSRTSMTFDFSDGKLTSTTVPFPSDIPLPASYVEVARSFAPSGLRQSVDDEFKYVKDNYYTKVETDALIPDTSNFALKSEIPSTSGLATEKYVDDKIANIDISGGNSGSSNIYVFEKSLRYFTDNDKAKIQEIFDYMTANGKMMECELWYPFTSSHPVKITSVIKGSQGLELFLADINDGYKRSIYCVFSNGVYSYCYQNEEQKGGGWRWSDDSGLSSISFYSLIKVVGYFNGDTDAIGTFLITTSNGNTFDNEYGTRYYSTWAYEMNMGTVNFYNEGSSLSMSFNSDNGCTFTILGYYYQG